MKKNNDQPEIPKGMYCYTTIVDAKGNKKIKICPYWKAKLFNGVPGARCEFLKKDSEEYSSNLIWDQVKACGINKEYDD